MTPGRVRAVYRLVRALRDLSTVDRAAVLRLLAVEIHDLNDEVDA